MYYMCVYTYIFTHTHQVCFLKIRPMILLPLDPKLFPNHKFDHIRRPLILTRQLRVSFVNDTLVNVMIHLLRCKNEFLSPQCYL